MARRDKGLTQILPRSQPAHAQAPGEGGPEAFFRSHYHELLRVARYAGASADEGEVAVQEAMIQVCRNWSKIEEPWPWARVAVVNNYIKVKKREAERLSRTISGGHLTPEGYGDTNLTVWEDTEWVNQLLSKLPPAQREVMAFIVEGWQPREVAILLGKTAATVRQNLKLARDRLKRELGQQEHEQEAAKSVEQRMATREEVK